MDLVINLIELIWTTKRHLIPLAVFTSHFDDVSNEKSKLTRFEPFLSMSKIDWKNNEQIAVA